MPGSYKFWIGLYKATGDRFYWSNFPAEICDWLKFPWLDSAYCSARHFHGNLWMQTQISQISPDKVIANISQKKF